MDEQNIKNLIARVRKKDKEAFEELYEYYYDRLFGYSFKRTLNISDAEDITANVILKLLKKINNFVFRPRANSFHAWVFRIANNEIIDFQRGKNRIQEQITDDLENKIFWSRKVDGIEENQIKIDQDIDLKKINVSLKKLSDFDQSIISLRFFEDLDFKSISMILKKNEKSIRMNLSRAMKRLRNQLNEK